MKTLCAIIIFSITGIISVYGQSVSEFNLSDNVPKIVPPSQNAISLGKYGGFTSTSNFSGAANVSIPIYTLQGRYLSVPILLNYNTTGFKVDELSSWVGYGWALQTGGLITRVVYDKPDELHLSDNIPYRMFDVIQTMTPDLVDFVQNYESHDLQPDVFYFNFLNYSGKFFLSRKGSGTAILYASAIPYSNLEIKYIHSSNSFEVKDYSGTTYTFSETEMTKHDASPNKTFDDYAVTSWYLSTITHPAEESISFTYENMDYQYRTGITQTYTYGVNNFVAQCPNPGLHENLSTSVLQVLGKVLKTISYLDETIEFISSTNRYDASSGYKKLDLIKVWHNSALIKSSILII